MNNIVIYTSRYCPYCQSARALLDDKGVSYQAIETDGKPELRQEMIRLAGSHTVPQIWISDQHIGGCDELYQLEQQGLLDPMIEKLTEQRGNADV